MVIALVLIAVEVAFSFDNAILNAKILTHMSRFWQNMFLTVGALIAVFGMRILFPILIVMLTADLGWGQVVDLALHHPKEYTEHLEQAHPALSAFGGAFLLVLALEFLADKTRGVHWLVSIERPFQKYARGWAPAVMTLAAVSLVSLLPFNHDKKTTLVAGVLGVIVFSAIHGLTESFGKVQRRSMRGAVYTGAAALISFIYLEVLDATFSFDSVLGAFAVTTDVVLIAIGLGVGAFWVRSLTIFMVRRGTLGNYRFIEHGAHYTILVLAVIFFLGLFIQVPEVITGLTGLGIIAASIIASRQALMDGRKS